MRVLKVRVISLPYIFHGLYVLCFTRPTYQVSVYRTIGPLVLFWFGFCSRILKLQRSKQMGSNKYGNIDLCL